MKIKDQNYAILFFLNVTHYQKTNYTNIRCKVVLKPLLVKDADVAQWQSAAFVKPRLRVQIPPSAVL